MALFTRFVKLHLLGELFHGACIWSRAVGVAAAKNTGVVKHMVGGRLQASMLDHCMQRLSSALFDGMTAMDLPCRVSNRCSGTM